MFAVIFKSESGDSYQAVFMDKPTDEELKRYMLKSFPYEIEDNVCYVHVNSIEEVELATIPSKEDVSSLKNVEFL